MISRTQGGQVEAGETPGVIELRREHGGNAVNRAALLLYGLERRQRVEPFGGKHHRRARCVTQPDPAHRHPETVIERHGDGEPVLPGEVHRGRKRLSC